MSRQVERQLGRKLKSLNDKEAYKVLEKSMYEYGVAVYDDVIAVLIEDFGFGDKRLTRLSEAFQRKQAARE